MAKVAKKRKPSVVKEMEAPYRTKRSVRRDAEAFLRIPAKKAAGKPGLLSCARLFAENSRDGVYSHGLNRFPSFVQDVKEVLVDVQAGPECISANGSMEHWDGRFGIGMYNAMLAMNRTIGLAKQTGLGLVTLNNNNHWMRGGS